MKRLAHTIVVLLAAAGFVYAQPHIVNGKVENVSAAAGLAAAVKQAAGSGTAPVWVAYAVPVNDSKPRTMCCFNSVDQAKGNSCCGTCTLENESGNFTASNSSDCAQSGPQDVGFIFLRYAAGELTRIRAFSPNCAIDAAGTTVRWLADAKPRESVALLASFADNNDASHRVLDGALFAIAVHGDAAADEALARFVAPERPEKTRQKAAFWLAAERGKSGFALLQKLARDDKDDRFRRQLTFDLTVTAEPAAIDELIRMAHQDADSGVRGQALFWLAQKAGKKVVGEIANAIENDPDTEVKKKAVFALTQMPGDEGVTRLIDVARSNRNREVRKQAIFWLGQSHDPRALAFIEEILSR